MKIRNFILGATMALAFPAAAQQIDPLAKAMLDSYNEILSESPKDYQTLYQRAAQYYRLGQYEDAYNDITKAVQYTPEKETEMARQEFSLMADIALEVKDYDKALMAVDKALQIDPESYADIYKKGNVCLYLNRPQDAYNAFKSLQRLKSRSQEAYFGMAKASIMMDNYQEARALLDEARNADPSNFITYCRIGDLYRDMSEDENAATNYIMAFSLARNPQRPLQSLISLGYDDFNSVCRALDYALSKTSNKAPLYLLKGNIAYHTGNFQEADNAISSLLAMPEGRDPSVYALMANIDIALDRQDEAVVNIDKALQDKNNPAYCVIRANALLNGGQAAASLIEARRALESAPTDTDALFAAAKAAYALGDKANALEYLGDVVMNDPEAMEPLLFRAALYSESGDEKAAAADYARIASMESLNFPDATYRAIAKAKTGKAIDANSIIEKALKSDSGRDAQFYIALYHAQTGNKELASEALHKAISMGYANRFELDSNTTPGLSIAPIRAQSAK